mgnify:CR=1 FL=1
MTGCYPQRLGFPGVLFPGDAKGLHPNEITIAEVLKTAGYSTYVSGKWHVTGDLDPDGAKRNWPNQRGFDDFYGIITGASGEIAIVSGPALPEAATTIEIGDPATTLGEPIRLTQKEFELAAYMLQNPGKLLSRVHLLEKLWGLNAEVDTRTVDTHVSRIRRKLSVKPENGWQVVPEYGYGYRMERIEMPDSG